MRKTRGFTLVEMMMSVALFSMMMLLVGMILQRGEAQTQLNDNKMIIQNNLREAVYKMSQEIRKSSPSRVTVSNGGALLTFQIPASISNSGTITWSSPITYQVGGNGSQLIRTDTGTNRTTILANDIQSVSFTANGAPIATVTYTTAGRRTLTNGRVLTVTSGGEARLRNR